MPGYLVRLIYRARKYDGLFELFDTCFIRDTSASDEILHKFFGISWELHTLKKFFRLTQDSFLLSVILLLLCSGYELLECSHLRFISTHICDNMIIDMRCMPRGKIFWKAKRESRFTKELLGNITRCGG